MMNKKIITTTAIAGILLLLLAVLPASAAIQATSVEIRGTLYNDSAGERTTSWNASNFAGFWYDFNDGMNNENLTIYLDSVHDRDIGKDDLVYRSVPVSVNFEHNDWGMYDLIGFMAEKYIAAYNNTNPEVSSNKDLLSKGYLSEVLIDEDDKHTITIGSTLPLKEGYALKAIDISVGDTLVRFVLLKDGEEVTGSDEIVDKGENYVYEKKIGNVSDVPIIIVYVETVFHGRETDEAFIRGVFQISENPIEIKTGDDYGIMEVTSRNGSIVMKNNDSFELGSYETINVTDEIKFKVADNGVLRFYPMVTRTEPGTYEVRGAIYNDTASERTTYWDVNNFAGFTAI